MLLFVLCLLGFGALAAFELPPLLKPKQRGELLTAGAVWVLALVYCSLLLLHLPKPDLNWPIKVLFGGQH